GTVGRELAQTERDKRAIRELEAKFRPEFLNRIDEVIIFDSLTREQIRGIVVIQIERLNAVLAGQNLSVSASDRAIEHLAELGYDPAYGARPLKRVIQREVQNRLAEAILRGEVSEGSSLRIDLDGDSLVFIPE
ncbi:MAG: hypothetical protein KAH31_06650, partial [Candidatus Sabulitectum sp.]|nr:hypothetical protein [Candidatus Sabulitectum sp.]